MLHRLFRSASIRSQSYCIPFLAATVIIPHNIHLDCEMCEFCNNPFASNKDAQHVEFAGFFSAASIDAAVRRAKQQDVSDDERSEDSDGT